MESSRENLLSEKSVYIISLTWLVFISLSFFPAWHPLSLIGNQALIVPKDVLASIFMLSSEGLPTLLYLMVLATAALGAGSLILTPLRLALDTGQRLVFSFAAGLAVLSYLSFFLGVAGLYNTTGKAVALCFILSGLVFGARLLYAAAREMRSGVAKLAWQDILFVSVLLIVGIFLLGKALRPAVFYDALAYHLGVPNYYIQEGGIKYIPYDSFSNFPFFAEMLYTLGMLISGLKLAQYINILMFVSCALVVYDFCRSVVDGLHPALPATLFVLTPAFVENSILYTNDLFLTYYTIMVVYSYFIWTKDGHKGFLLLAGLFTGICLGTKYIAYISIFIPACLAVAWNIYAGRGKYGYRSMLIFIGAAIAAVSPWLVKNLIYTGNPLYPALYGVFGGRDMTQELYKNIFASVNHPGFGQAVKGLWEHPWRLFLSSPGVTSKTYGAASYLGLIPLVFAPCLLLMGNTPRVIKKLCMLALVMYLFWDFFFPITRYLYPALAVTLILSAYAFARLVADAPAYVRAAFVIPAVFYLVFCLCLSFFMVNAWTASPGFAGLHETDDEFLVRRMDAGGGPILYTYPALSYINNNLPEDVRVLLIGDCQGLYLKRRYVYTYVSAATAYSVFKEKNGRSGEVWAALKDEGITHIVFNPGELERLERGGIINYREADNHFITDFLTSPYAKEIVGAGPPGGRAYLFELSSHGQ